MNCGRPTSPDRVEIAGDESVYTLGVDQRGWCAVCRFMEPVSDYDKGGDRQQVRVEREPVTGPVWPLPPYPMSWTEVEQVAPATAGNRAGA